MKVLRWRSVKDNSKRNIDGVQGATYQGHQACNWWLPRQHHWKLPRWLHHKGCHFPMRNCLREWRGPQPMGQTWSHLQQNDISILISRKVYLRRVRTHWDRDNLLIVVGAEAWISWCKLRAPLTSWLWCCGCQAGAGGTPVCSGLPGVSPSKETRSPVAWTWGCPGEGRRRGCQGRWRQAGGCQLAGAVHLALDHTLCWQFWNEIHLDYLVM